MSICVHLCLLAFAVPSAGAVEALVMADSGPPFGELPLVEEVRCGDPDDAHPFAESEPGVSRIETILGETCRVLPNLEGGGVKYFAYRIGEGWDLQPGAAYLLTVDYPEDQPRAMFVINRGCETTRGFRTGAALGDVAVGYTDNVLDSLKVPLSGRRETWRMFFHLHDRFPGLTVPRGKGPRPHLPAEGFWVIIAQFPHKQSPRSAGAAVSRIRLFMVPGPERFYQPLRMPPDDLPRRHIFWREEMSDGVVGRGTDEERGVLRSLDWYEYKARLMRFLGVNTYCKDLLEFGHNQGWDSTPHGSNDWVYQSHEPKRWEGIVEIAGRYGLDVLPYYEYAGSVGGGKALGNRKRCVTLAGGRNFTNISWCQTANADVTDPDTLEDARKVLDCTIVRHKDKARFVGAWFRPRPAHMPISFSDRCLDLFARETAEEGDVTRELLRQDEAMLLRYYDWWFGKRREFLVGLRDYLREKVDPDAAILFTADSREPGPSLVHNHRVVVTDDVDSWKPTLWDLWGWTITPRDRDTMVAEGKWLEALLRPRSDWEEWENRHGNPEPDPQRYAQTDGVLLTYPFSRTYTVSSPEALDAFRTASGLALARHYTLNENTMEGKLGYFVSDVERAGPYCMAAEALAMANGDPRYIGYLAAASFNRGFPEYVRNFNAAFLSLPALPSEVVPDACADPEVVVRAIRTEAHGTWLAVVNVGFGEKDVTIALPAEGTLTDAATGEPIDSTDGTVRLSLHPCQLRTLHVK